MSRESTFQDNKQDPDKTLPTSDDPGKYDPLKQADLDDEEGEQEWNERDRKLPEADEQTPLSDDRR
jgi:hypothetical protein